MQATLGETARWSTSDYLLAHVVDAVRALVSLLQHRWRKKGAPVKKWEPFPRPGMKPSSSKLVMGRGGGIAPAEMRKFLDARRRGGDDDG